MSLSINPRPSVSPRTSRETTVPTSSPRPAPYASDGFETSQPRAVALTTPVAVNTVEGITTDRTTWLRVGSSGPAVEDLQKMLRDAGFDPGPLDGKFGPRTQAALRAFQEANGCRVDGIVGPETRAALLRARETEGTTPAEETAPPEGAGEVTEPPGVGDTETARRLEAEAREKLGDEFVDELKRVAERLGVKPEWLLAVIDFESNFNPAAVNPHSSATGLIQFTRRTAEGLGTSIEELRNMSPIDQLRYVEAYYAPYKGKLNSASDLYMATFYPAALGKPDSYQLGGSLVAEQNPIFDTNRDGRVTAGEVREYYRNRYPELM